LTIRILADDVASQIAAGEVVERPASVVKELLENALDAAATSINIIVKQAGKRFIEISDNGVGIPASEMKLAVARHATSKLSNAEDLFHIRSLGFRGEALASIGSVSRMTVLSRVRDAEIGAKLVVEGGSVKILDKAGLPVGTVVRVEDLFFNVPARLKFLKTDQTERNQISALVTRYAMAYPTIRMTLIQDDRTVLQTNGNGDRREVMTQIYGIDIARQMLEVSLEEEGSIITGFISPVALTRSNRKEITFFVNGRWVQDISLNSALLQAYHTLLMVGRYPLTFILVVLTPENVDVNVHPAKAEVRFQRPDKVFSMVQRAVRRALLAYSPVPQITTTYWKPLPENQRLIDPAWEMSADLSKDLIDQAVPIGDEAVTGDDTQQRVLPSGKIPLLRLVGQVGAAYIVAEGPDGLYLIDQHAAHERILFERYLHQKPSTTPSQTLLEPATVQLQPSAAHLLEQQMSILKKIGYDVEEFGPNTFRIRAIPAIFSGSDPAAALRVVVEDFEEDETPLQSEEENRIAARICKRAAVKAGHALSVEEQAALLRDLETCQSPRTCPHGRPTMIHLSVDLLERQFGRRGSR
jgi:DNA mismatch repair protein MutL